MPRPAHLTIRVFLLLALTLRLLPAPLLVLLAPIDPLAGMSICHSGTPAPNEPAAPAPHHDCTLCPVCVWPAQAALATAGAWSPAPPRVGTTLAGSPPQATGPPSPRAQIPQPRGPPA